jgi:hypothetical protein
MSLGLLAILGSTIMYFTGLDVSKTGFAFACLNVVLSSAERIAQRTLWARHCGSLSPEMCMLLNNIIGLFPTVAIAIWLGEVSSMNFNMWLSSSTISLLLLSGIIGIGISHIASAVRLELANVSFMVLQNLVRVAVVIVGVFVFHDPYGWPLQALGLVFSFVASLWYGKSLIEEQIVRSTNKRGGHMRSTDPSTASIHAGQFDVYIIVTPEGMQVETWSLEGFKLAQYRLPAASHISDLAKMISINSVISFLTDDGTVVKQDSWLGDHYKLSAKVQAASMKSGPTLNWEKLRTSQNGPPRAQEGRS